MSRSNDKRYEYLKEAIDRYRTIVDEVDLVTHSHRLDPAEKARVRENAKNIVTDLLALSRMCNIEVSEQAINDRVDVWLYMIHGQELTPRKISKKNIGYNRTKI